jgi:hypothetical protein
MKRLVTASAVIFLMSSVAAADDFTHRHLEEQETVHSASTVTNRDPYEAPIIQRRHSDSIRTEQRSSSTAVAPVPVLSPTPPAQQQTSNSLEVQEENSSHTVTAPTGKPTVQERNSNRIRTEESSSAMVTREPVAPPPPVHQHQQSSSSHEVQQKSSSRVISE